jgi:molecular chaperone HtpG
MKKGQEFIYYATGQSVEQLDKIPATEQVRDMGYEILYLTDNVDEFCIKIIGEFDKHKFMSVASPDLDLKSTTNQTEDKSDKHKALLSAVAEILKDKVSQVIVSKRLKTHAVCLSSKGEISIEMEKVLSAMPDKSRMVKAEKVLELNSSHSVFAKLKSLHESKSDDFARVVRVLYTTARIIEGLSVEDSVGFSQDLCSLI